MSRMAYCRFIIPFALFVLAPLTSLAQTSSFNLPAQPLAESLKAVGAQTGLNIMVSPPLVDGKQAPALKANVSAKDALERLLAGTKLEYHFVNDQTVVIRETRAAVAASDPPLAEPATPPTQDTTKEAGKRTSQDFRVAQVDQTVAGPPLGAPDQSQKEGKIGLQEIVVTGTHLTTPSDAVHADLSTYTSADIQASGQVTLADFLNTLPAVSSLSSETAFSYTGAISTVRLHGFPVGTTLVLLNGHRLSDSGFSFFRGEGFDLNYIPVSAIERIDVSPVGGSAIYGSDAMAGVINIVLKKNISGADIALNYGHEEGASEDSANLALGATSDRGSVSLLVSAFHRDNLAAAQRPLTANADYSGIGGPDNRVSYCNPGTISSIDGSNLPGLGAPVAAVPNGGSARPTIGDFIPTAGQTNLCTENRWSLIPESDRVSGILSGSYRLANDIEFFSEVLLAKSRQDVGQYSAGFNSPSNPVVPASNAFNPFGTDVLAENSLWLGPPKTDYDSSLIRPLVGARGNLVSDWTWELSTSYSNESNHQTYSNVYLNQNALAAALASSNPATAINLFSSGPIGSPALLGALRDTSEGDSSFGSQATLVSGLLRGTLFQLPAGGVQSAIGAEYLYNAIRLNQGAGTDGAQSLSRSVHSAFLEVRAPILGPILPQLRSPLLSVTAAARTDSYSDVGTRTTPQFGIGLQPLDEFLITTTYGRTFRAPQLFQLYYPATTAVYPITDPETGQMYNTTVNTVGNPKLVPETGVTKSIGFGYSGKSGVQPKASATFWSLSLNNYVQLLNFPELLTYESLFPDSVIRGPNGQITSIQQAFYNFGQINVRGLDISADISLDSKVGVFKPSFAFTYIEKYTAQVTPLTPETNRVSAANDDNLWAPRWKGVVGLGWKLGPMGASVTGRYTGPYLDYLDGAAAREIGNFWYLDANLRYDLKQHLGRWAFKNHDAYVSVSVVNALNKLPPFSDNTFGLVGYDNAQYDIRGRFVSAEVGYGF